MNAILRSKKTVAGAVQQKRGDGVATNEKQKEMETAWRRGVGGTKKEKAKGRDKVAFAVTEPALQNRLAAADEDKEEEDLLRSLTDIPHEDDGTDLVGEDGTGIGWNGGDGGDHEMEFVE